VVVEEPGNPRMRQLLHQHQATAISQAVDENGMVINTRLDDAQIIYVTPSHQVPTAVTMPMQRRRALLKKARELDQLIIEDDFEHDEDFDESDLDEEDDFEEDEGEEVDDDEFDEDEDDDEDDDDMDDDLSEESDDDVSDDRV